MIFLYIDPIEPFMNLIIIVVFFYFIIGLRYMYKNGVIEKGSTVPPFCCLLVILILILVSILLGSISIENFDTLTLAALWSLGNITLGFIILLYIFRPKKKLSRESEIQEPITKIRRDTSYSGLKLGVFIIIAGALTGYKFYILIFNWIISWNLLFLILTIVIASFILIGSIYSLNHKKYSTYGSIICIVGSFQNLFIFQFITVGAEFFTIDTMIPVLLVCLPIFGVILHYSGRKAGSILCISIGAVYLALIFISLGFSGFFILSEPILLMIGGYILYRETLRK